jgi:peptide/nickel transport system substrate-binding protein
MRTFKLFASIIVVLVVILTIFFGACKSASTTPQTTAKSPASTTQAATTASPATQQPQTGGTLKLITTSTSIASLGDPLKWGFPSEPTFTQPTLQSLVRLNKDGLPEPFLATGWQTSPDNLTLTFTLRQSVKFHDGTDFKADSVKMIVDRWMADPSPVMKNVKSCDIVDNYTVKFTLKFYDDEFWIQMAKDVVVTSPTAFKAHPLDWFLTHECGTGPFTLVNYQPDTIVSYKKFADYWEKGKPYLDGIDYLLIADSTTAATAFQAGGAQAAGDLWAPQVAQLKQISSYTFNSAPAAVLGIVPDSATPGSPFADVRVRQAIAYALDRPSIIKAASSGVYTPADQPCPTASPFYNKNVVGYPFNQAKAKQLLADAGYANGLSVTLTMSTDPTEVAIYTAIQQYLGQVGITAKINSVNIGAWVQMMFGGWKDQLVNVGFGYDDDKNPAPELRSHFSSSGVWCKTTQFPQEYNDTLAKALAEPDYQKKVALTQQLMQLFVDKYCINIPLWLNSRGYFTTSQVHGLDLGQHWGAAFWRPAEVWLSK